MSNELVGPEGKKVKATESISDLIEKMAQTFDELCLNVIDEDTAAGRCQVANTVCNVIKTEMLYKKLKGDVLNIKFLENKNVVKQQK